MQKKSFWQRFTCTSFYEPAKFKGQLISKGLFGILEFFQKTNEQKKSIRFLEESSAWKKHYDFDWPLEVLLIYLLTVSTKRPFLIFLKSSLNFQYYLFFSRSLEQPGLIIETLE